MIYFAQTNDNRFIKIGYTKSNARERIASLQTGSPVEIKLLATMPGTPAIERQIHKRFAGLRGNGEWFHAHPNIISFAVRSHAALVECSDTDAFIPYAIMEPRILDLLIRASGIVDNPDDDGFCANDVFYGHGNWKPGLKKEVEELVGWFADKSYRLELRTEAAYDAVYDKIYEALPDCRNCWCM